MMLTLPMLAHKMIEHTTDSRVRGRTDTKAELSRPPPSEECRYVQNFLSSSLRTGYRSQVHFPNSNRAKQVHFCQQFLFRTMLINIILTLPVALHTEENHKFLYIVISII